MKQKLLLVLMAMFFAGTVFGQTRQLTGRVTSATDRQPIPGVVESDIYWGTQD